MDRIEFGAFKLTDTTKKNVLDCLESGWLTMGPNVKKFEARWKQLFGYGYARMVSSGTTADTACLMALYELVNAKQGDEIICPALSFIATGTSIRAAGFKPVFVDVRKETLNIDETQIEDKITEKTRAILAVNLMGRPSELDQIQAIAKRHNLIVIVDNCEAYGSKFKGHHSLHYADMETSSHFLAHIIFAVEGGVVSTNDEHIDSLIESIRSHGRMGGNNYFHHPVWGLNFKASDLHASVGLEEANLFWQIYNRRMHHLRALRMNCFGYEDQAWFVEEDGQRENAPHAFSITLKDPTRVDALKKALDDADIAWKRNFGCMATQHRVFSYLGHKEGDFPNAEYIGNNGIHIGVHRHLTHSDLDRINSALNGFFRWKR